MSGKIVEWEGYGAQIPLTCINHPEKRWSTKNIDCIGMRSIFYNLRGVEGMGPECDCPASCLRPLTEDETLADMFSGRWFE